MTRSEVLSDFNTCTGCNSCVNICPKDAITIEESLLGIRAIIDEDRCVHCALCKKVCQNHADIALNKPLKAVQGWNTELQERLNSSSGGFVSAITKLFLANRDCVYACLFENGRFVFREVKNMNDFEHFRGSKYVKSDTGRVYQEIKGRLANNNKVLFIGLPCQVQGLKSYLMGKFDDSLITIDLICHGTPAQALYKKYLQEKGCNTDQIDSIKFRNKNKYFAPYKRKYEYWLSPFLSGLTYTENCYNCKFSRFERVADYTVGDSWGSELGQDEIDKGVSIVLCNTEKAVKLLDSIPFDVYNVDIIEAISNNAQLSHSSIKPDCREKFKNCLENGQSYHKAVFQCYPKKIIITKIKSLPIVRGLKKSVPPISFTEIINKR